uniref:Uncharacterized protein n=1 Tax=Rhodosorus marinus TaxID=101924 RepID=A0A7S2ZD39_9RHOD
MNQLGGRLIDVIGLQWRRVTANFTTSSVSTTCGRLGLILGLFRDGFRNAHLCSSKNAVVNHIAFLRDGNYDALLSSRNLGLKQSLVNVRIEFISFLGKLLNLVALKDSHQFFSLRVS